MSFIYTICFFLSRYMSRYIFNCMYISIYSIMSRFNYSINFQLKFKSNNLVRVRKQNGSSFASFGLSDYSELLPTSRTTTKMTSAAAFRIKNNTSIKIIEVLFLKSGQSHILFFRVCRILLLFERWNLPVIVRIGRLDWRIF